MSGEPLGELLGWTRRFGAHTAIVLAYLERTSRARADAEGWFTAPQEEVQRQTRIRPETFLNARAKLTEAGLLETARREEPGPNYYRLDRRRLGDLGSAP